ncbi:mitochondrial inner membrane protein Oxa1p [[Candida] anglica]
MLGSRVFPSVRAARSVLAGSTRVSAAAGMVPCRVVKSYPAVAASMTGGVRFNSTSTSSDIQTTLPNFDTLAETASNALPALSSDQIGYLNSIGLADGWGPTATIERILEATHVYSGLPWWGTIIAATVGIRVLMVPLYIKASANAAKMSKVKPELDQCLSDMQNASNQQEQMEAAAARKKIMKAHDIHMTHQLFPILQLPVAYGFFQALRKMAAHPVDGFADQGYAWFTDLSAVDPYCGLQALAAVVVIGMVRSGGETGAQQMNPLMKKMMTYLPIASIFITKNFAGAVVLYFAANSIFSFAQTTLLRSAWFRRMVNLPDITAPPPPAPGAPKAPATVSEWWTQFNETSNKKVEKKMKSSNAKVEAMQRRKAAAASPDNFIKKH